MAHGEVCLKMLVILFSGKYILDAIFASSSGDKNTLANGMVR